MSVFSELGISRGLIIRSPHIEKFFNNSKQWEMRSRKNQIEGKIGLIKSGSGMVWATAQIMKTTFEVPSERRESLWAFHRVDDLSKLEKWRYPWPIIEVKMLPEPIPYKHKQGAVIWVNLP